MELRRADGLDPGGIQPTLPARQCGTKNRRVDHWIDRNDGGYSDPPYEKVFWFICLVNHQW